MLFEQVVGDGASIFISIVAVIIGFGVAMGYIDYLKTEEESKKHEQH
jgi:hypothetical protein